MLDCTLVGKRILMGASAGFSESYPLNPNKEILK
jgi:hypothetical protein